MDRTVVGVLEFRCPQVKAREILYSVSNVNPRSSPVSYLSDVIVVLSMNDVVVSVKTVLVSVSVLYESRVSGFRVRCAVSLSLCCRA